MKRTSLIALLCLAGICGCTSTNVTGSSRASAPDTPAPAVSGSLSSLLTGQVVSSEEQQLRDIKTRQILLDFPIKVGVVYYQLQSQLEPEDLESEFARIQTALKDSGLVRETLRIPAALIGSGATLEELRRLGARFQCDILVLITGSHRFDKSAQQNLGFLDSFSDKAYFESEVRFESIPLDTFTGVLLSPFDAVSQSGPYLLDRSAADFAAQRYRFEREAETKVWQELLNKALAHLKQLRADVEQRKADLARQQPSPTPSQTPPAGASPSPSPTSSPISSPISSPTSSPTKEPSL